jgi:hypothetical protein
MNKPNRARRIVVLVVAAILVVPANIQAALHAYSSDGEATVYISGDFSQPFDLSYAATIDETPRNRSWSYVGILLLGDPLPSDSVEVGLFRVAGSRGRPSLFTSITMRGSSSGFKDEGLCAPNCVIELRGDRTNIEALANRRVIHRRKRTEFHMAKSYIQLNGEVALAADKISARLRPLKTTLDSHSLRSPTCAFTTQGIEVRQSGDHALTFEGTFRPASKVAYYSLADGKSGCK